TGDPCHKLGEALPAPPLRTPPPDVPAIVGGPGVVLYADTSGPGGNNHYESIAQSRPLPPPISVLYGTSLMPGWSADAAHTNCFIATTFPPGVEVNGITTGSNWTLGESPQSIGPLTVPGIYTFHIDCDDAIYDQYSARLTFEIAGPSPTVLQVNGILNGVG